MIPDTPFFGQSRQDQKEYAFSLITQIKLNEKLAAECEADAEKWTKRAALARGRNGVHAGETPAAGDAANGALAVEAEARAEAARSRAAALNAENAELKAQAEQAIRSLPALAARERSVDPDLLLQEL
ncbi:MAG: hypothetical protein LBG26_02685, partial [Treponema sp.]|nr:hypothetical protein [Treponema sp.]